MTEPKELYKHPLTVLAVFAGVAGLFIVYKLVKAGEKAGEAIGNVAKESGSTIFNTDASDPNNLNAGTPYAGAGVIGTLGNAVNKLLGGLPESLGSWSGGAIYDLFHPDYDPFADTSATDQHRSGNPYQGVSPRTAAAKDNATPDATASASTYANVDWYSLQ